MISDSGLMFWMKRPESNTFRSDLRTFIVGFEVMSSFFSLLFFFYILNKSRPKPSIVRTVSSRIQIIK